MILTNTIIISTDAHPISQEHFKFLEMSNYAFFGIFTVEMVIKLSGLGFRWYIRDRFNIFDAMIVFVNTVDIVLS